MKEKMFESDELLSLKELASAWIKVNDQELNNSISKGLLKEVNYE